MSHLYQNPRYYEIAFSFRDIPAEVDVLEECMSRYSTIPVRSVLEIACGNSPHMEELLGRGYRYLGFDLSEQMLSYSRGRIGDRKDRAHLFRADLVDFTVAEPVDFAYIMLGSLYVQDTRQLVSHLGAVSRALRRGGVYFLDWCVSFEPLADTSDSWTMKADGITVDVRYSGRLVNSMEQTFCEEIKLSVDDHGTPVTLSDTAVRRAVYPQEFLLLLDLVGTFEFVGWWNNWNLETPLTGSEKSISRPITVIRRK